MCLLEGIDTFSRLLFADGCCMIDNRMLKLKLVLKHESTDGFSEDFCFNGTAKGNDDISAKSKRGKRVQFTEGLRNDKSDFFSKSDGKFDSARGNMNKGGKGDKTSNDGKAKDPLPLELRIEQAKNPLNQFI